MYSSTASPGIRVALTGTVTTSRATLRYQMIADAAAHTKGTWAEVVSSTEHEVNGVHILISDTGLSGDTRRALIDIGVGAAGSETVLVPNILSSAPVDFAFLAGNPLFLPIRIPAGTRVAIRMQSTTGSDPGYAFVAFNYGDGLVPVFTGCDALGVTTGTTSGVSVTSAAGAYGTYTSIATLSKSYKAILPVLALSTAATNNSFVALEVAINRGSDVTTFRRGFRSRAEDVIVPQGNLLPFYAKFYSGDVLKARTWASAAVPFGVALYGFY